jgi:hypothetical protein
MRKKIERAWEKYEGNGAIRTIYPLNLHTDFLLTERVVVNLGESLCWEQLS